MAIPSFYCPALTVDVLSDDEATITLSENESAHAIRSRRLKVGQVVNLLNGCGIIAKGTICKIDRRAVLVQVDSYEHVLPAHTALTIATAIPKGDRQKVMVDMLTQLGVSEIVPLSCEHSVTRYSDNLGEKWQRTAIEATKQSQNPWLPIITKGCRIEELLDRRDCRFMYADGQGEGMAALCHELEENNDSSLILLIGPEGGFSPSEINYFLDHNVRPFRLTKHILRTEAAAVAATAQFMQINE